MFFCIFLYCGMYNYMHLCKNKGKNMTKITTRLMIPNLNFAACNVDEFYAKLEGAL